jgi:hypothetical protein
LASETIVISLGYTPTALKMVTSLPATSQLTYSAMRCHFQLQGRSLNQILNLNRLESLRASFKQAQWLLKWLLKRNVLTAVERHIRKSCEYNTLPGNGIVTFYFCDSAVIDGPRVLNSNNSQDVCSSKSSVIHAYCTTGNVQS